MARRMSQQARRADSEPAGLFRRRPSAEIASGSGVPASGAIIPGTRDGACNRGATDHHSDCADGRQLVLRRFRGAFPHQAAVDPLTPS
jgi:hypothetical protein